MPPVFGLAVAVVISALLLLERAPLVLITIIDLVLYTAIVYKFGINDDDKRLILGLLPLRLIKAEM